MDKPLYSLIIGTVSFIAIFVMFVNFIPGESYIPYKTYEASYIRDETLRASDINLFNQSDSFVLSSSLATWIKKDYGMDIRFKYYLSTLTNAFSLRVRHVEVTFPVGDIPVWFHPLRLSNGQETVFIGHIIDNYDNDTGVSTVQVSCEHLTLKITVSSNDTSDTLFEAIYSASPLKLDVNYEIDYSSMGANIWMILANVLTFQTIETDQIYLDAFLNSVVSIPFYTSIAYIIYKLVTGLIPTVSGGSGA